LTHLQQLLNSKTSSKGTAAWKKYQWKFRDLVSPVMAEAVPSGSERELARRWGPIFDQDHQLFCGDDVTNPHRMPDDRQAVIDVQNAIKKRGCYALAFEGR
jgi:hypothetical protein